MSKTINLSVINTNVQRKDLKMETTNDIVREIRAQQNGNVHTISAKEAYALADRIEKAHEFELAVEKAKAAGEGYAAGKQSVTDCNHLEQAVVRENPTSQESRHVGNAAKMREALESVENWCINKLGSSRVQITVEGLLEIVQKTLAEPPRNCDVGTAEEQEKRFLEFCKFKCRYCECSGGNNTHCCASRWAQLPYEAK